MGKWDYKDNSAPKLTSEFRQAYLTNIKGKEAVTAVGLTVLGHEKGFKELKTEIVQYPNNANDMTCIVKADLIGYGWSPSEEKVVEVAFSAIGDANPANCSKMVAASFIRMAETRAIGRVLRNYTNIGMLCSDEIGSATEIQVEPIRPEQMHALAGLMKQNNITPEMGRDLMIDNFSKTDLRTLSFDEANRLIQIFNHTKPQPQQQIQQPDQQQQAQPQQQQQAPVANTPPPQLDVTDDVFGDLENDALFNEAF